MENDEKQCCICNSSDSLLSVQEKWICEKCLHIGNEKLAEPWKDSIEQLMKKYTDSCNKFISDVKLEEIHEIEFMGQKLQAVLEFIGLPTQHELFLSVGQIDQIVKKAREVDILLDEMMKEKEENQVYSKMIKLLTKKQKKWHKALTEKIQAVITASFVNKTEDFLNNKFVAYIAPMVKEDAVAQYEDSFKRLVDTYHQLLQEKGKMAADTIHALHSVQVQSKSLRYIYNYLNETFGESNRDKEMYYKDLQAQFGEINDLEEWLYHLKANQKKLDASKSDVKNIKKKVKIRLEQVIEQVKLNEVSV